ncbi:hypothetical protein NMQ01_01650 [Janibacter sp. CX7]|uniref:hypothetical protein n=1 Tax=Janibacter sp. CX7 TaxID=2963431 RepID=UPI0020CD8C2F|nr:hypothetical protein [Janibacter sp. CX7]UTT66445.1 hypothetical protein NMQ01_01650 [Janibacter sp. CX7]
MIRAAVVVPAAPALLPGIGGTADPLADLRERAAALVATTAGAKGADRLVVVGSGPATRVWPGDAPSGAARFTTGRVPDGALPTDLEIGRLLAPSTGGDVVLQSVATDATPQECADLGRELAAGPPAVLVVVADGPATLTEKAPGHLQLDAAPFAAELSRAVAQADSAALAALDPAVCDRLWMRGRPALQVLAAATDGLAGELVADEAPFGVQYLLARWA